METIKLTAADKRKLKQHSHSSAAHVLIGKNGLTQEIVKTLEKELECHELVKVRCNKFKEQREQFALELSKATKSVIIKIVGNVITLYRQSADESRHIL